MTRHTLRRAFSYMYLGGPRGAIRPACPRASGTTEGSGSSDRLGPKLVEAGWPGSHDGCSFVEWAPTWAIARRHGPQAVGPTRASSRSALRGRPSRWVCCSWGTSTRSKLFGLFFGGGCEASCRLPARRLMPRWSTAVGQGLYTGSFAVAFVVGHIEKKKREKQGLSL